MALERKVIGDPISYLGSQIVARFVGPDLLSEVDGTELGGFYMDLEAARAAGKRHIDAQIKAKSDAAKRGGKQS